ncbi:MAG: sugar kinase [Rhodobacteraceae bacterium]|nr:sugar kinase [Paracoccaceae bacterium]QEW22027.1 2-dehydro-3-deoxygluconokinase [Marinibacterium anthonyi]
MTDVICMGEAMVELSLASAPGGRAAVGFAGDTLNTAIYLKREAPGLNVAYATRLGRDPLSDQMVAMMQDEGLECALIPRHDTRLPGLYAISTDEAGERSFFYWRDQSAAREMLGDGGLSFADLGRAKVLYLSAITLAILPAAHRQALLDWLPDYRAGGGVFAFDSNYRPRLWPDQATARAAVGSAWRQTDIGLPSVDDEMALFGDTSEGAVLDRLAGFGVTSGALKRGASGPLALDGSLSGPYAPASRVIDSTAAGDSFNAGYLGARLTGADEAKALMAGHALASRVVGVKGAILPRTDNSTGDAA